MKTLTSYKSFLGFAVLVLLGAFIISISYVNKVALGSVGNTNEYIATTTANGTVYGSTITDDTVLATSSLTLGSVVVTGANTGIWNIYDATTSDVTKRKLASSSILVASFPASMAAGTYTFDVRLKDGLLIDLQSGVMPTTTLTWRR